jgi:hypothetical protein
MGHAAGAVGGLNMLIPPKHMSHFKHASGCCMCLFYYSLCIVCRSYCFDVNLIRYQF